VRENVLELQAEPDIGAHERISEPIEPFVNPREYATSFFSYKLTQVLTKRAVSVLITREESGVRGHVPNLNASLA
jgi:hypothetical protein